MASVLAQNPTVKGGGRVAFLASGDDSAATVVAARTEDLGFAPIKVSGLSEGELLAQGDSWGQLIFKDLVKLD